MSFSKVQICKMALALAGSSQQIDSLEFTDTETVPNEARLCALFWDLAYDTAARDADWQCLTDRKDISAAVTTAPAFLYSYAYSLPADCLRVLHMSEDVDWLVQGRTLLTDKTSVLIAYIRKTDDTGLYDPHFVEALATLLAAHLAPSLGVERGAERAETLLKNYNTVTLPRARWSNACERGTTVIDSSTWKDSRKW